MIRKFFKRLFIKEKKKKNDLNDHLLKRFEDILHRMKQRMPDEKDVERMTQYIIANQMIFSKSGLYKSIGDPSNEEHIAMRGAVNSFFKTHYGFLFLLYLMQECNFAETPNLKHLEFVEGKRALVKLILGFS